MKKGVACNKTIITFTPNLKRKWTGTGKDITRNTRNGRVARTDTERGITASTTRRTRRRCEKTLHGNIKRRRVMTRKFKRFGRLVMGFDFLPSIHLCWYYWNGKRRYYWGASWLFWYFVSIKGFEWEKEQPKNNKL